MRIGITFDLREDYARQGFDEEQTAEFDSVETIAAIEAALQSLDHRTERIGNAGMLCGRLVQGDRWDMVFNIAEGMHGFGRQALVPALLDAWQIPYAFSDPLTLSVTLHKAAAKHIVRDQGLRTPDFAVVHAPGDADGVDLPFPLFAKPVAEGTSKGISAASRVVDRAALRAQCARLLERYRQPVLVETYLPGRELTVGLLGTGAQARVLGVMELAVRGAADAGVYSYENKQHFDERVDARLATGGLADAAAELALRAWRMLGGRDGGRVDIRCDAEGQVNFLEANPLAGLHPTASDLTLIARLRGISYTELMREIMASAAARVTAPQA